MYFLLTALLAAPTAVPAQSSPAQLIILTGGSTQAEGDARLKNLAPVISAAGGIIEFHAGYPKVEKSADIEGLKPGFFIVVAGACKPADVAPALEAFKVLAPGTYAKPITWTGDVAPCPSLGESPGAGRGWSLEKSLTKGKLRVHAFQFEYLEDGGEYERKSWSAIAILEGPAKDQILAAESIDSAGEFATFGSISEKGTSIVLIDEHADGTCLGPGTIGVFEERITVSASKANSLQIERKPKKLKDHECPAEESYGDAPPDMPEE